MDKSPQSEGMGYLESLPRRVVTVYLPLLVFLFVLLFPFYWMGATSLKPNAELLSREANPFWVAEPTLANYHLLPSVRGDFLRKLGRFEEARVELERAASLTRNARERTLLLDRARACAEGA